MPAWLSPDEAVALVLGPPSPVSSHAEKEAHSLRSPLIRARIPFMRGPPPNAATLGVWIRRDMNFQSVIHTHTHDWQTQGSDVTV